LKKKKNFALSWRAGCPACGAKFANFAGRGVNRAGISEEKKNFAARFGRGCPSFVQKG
jgi:hypothetical protein